MTDTAEAARVGKPALTRVDPTDGRYVRTLAFALAAMLAGVAAFCAAVDPYGMLGTPAIAGLTARKPAAVDRPRLSKPYRVEQMDPATLVLGSSTASVGLDPDSPGWQAAHRPVFNLGLDGAPPLTQRRTLQHALVRARPKLVVLSTGFEETLQPARAARLNAAQTAFYGIEPRLRLRDDGQPNPDYPMTRLKDTVSSLLSLGAVQDSVATVLQRDGPWARDLTPAGHDKAGQLVRWTATDGPRALVEDKDRYNVTRLLRWQRDGLGWQLDEVARMVRAALAAGADVVVAIVPSYADQTEIRRQLGLGDRVQAWRTELLRDVSAAAQNTEGRVTVWDFSGPSPWTTEPLPPAGDTAHGMQWFFETVHFRPALGSLMIGRFEGGDTPPGLGATLTEATLTESGARQDEAARAWAERNPREVARIAAVIAAARR